MSVLFPLLHFTFWQEKKKKKSMATTRLANMENSPVEHFIDLGSIRRGTKLWQLQQLHKSSPVFRVLNHWSDSYFFNPTSHSRHHVSVNEQVWVCSTWVLDYINQNAGQRSCGDFSIVRTIALTFFKQYSKADYYSLYMEA